MRRAMLLLLLLLASSVAAKKRTPTFGGAGPADGSGAGVGGSGGGGGGGRRRKRAATAAEQGGLAHSLFGESALFSAAECDRLVHHTAPVQCVTCPSHLCHPPSVNIACSRCNSPPFVRLNRAVAASDGTVGATASGTVKRAALRSSQVRSERHCLSLRFRRHSAKE